MAEQDCTQQDCTSVSGPNFDNGNGNGNNGACTTRPGGGTACPPTTPNDPSCKPWQLSKAPDNCFIDGVVDEALGIGGADFNVYKLLGVHEQGQLVDVTGKGSAISGGALAGFPASNAFDIFVTEWRSLQQGSAAIVASSYIGYDFGEIKVNDDSRRQYGSTRNEASVRKEITAFAIKQSSNPNARVTQARLERSDDGFKWYGVQVVNLPDDDCLNTILTVGSVQNRYWRLRPITFTGGDEDRWAVQAFQMYDNYVATREDNIQDRIFLENRDRDYNEEPILIKGSYDLIDVQSELTRFGIELPSQTIYATVSFASCVSLLGRPLVIGDIIQLPSETQYSAEMEPIEKWMEVTDVAWSTEGYTPGWQPTLLRVVMQPAYVAQETQDIFGDLAENDIPGELGLQDKGDGLHPIFQDYSAVSETAEREARDDNPQRGAETSATIRRWEQEELDAAEDQGLFNLQKIGQNPVGFQTEDAMPPNNAPFTEGDAYPDNPTHGDYHRLTYDSIDSRVPARLYRYSDSKGRWVFLESDKRALNNSAQPILQEFLTSPTRVPNDQINNRDDH